MLKKKIVPFLWDGLNAKLLDCNYHLSIPIVVNQKVPRILDISIICIFDLCDIF